MFNRKFLKPARPVDVEARVFSRFPCGVLARQRVWSWLLLAAVLPVLSPVRARADEATPAAASTPATGATPAATAPAPAPDNRDELVYNDGDHIRGKFLQKDGTTIVFKSDRFGELRVAEADAKVVLAVPAAPGMPSTAPAVSSGPAVSVAMAAADADRLWVLSYLSPIELKRRLQRLFGAWHGKFQFSTELVTDTTSHDTLSGEIHLNRKWTSDDLQINGSYNYSETDNLVTTDIVKADSSWRHDFPHKLFSVYHPSIEWNRAYLNPAGVPTDYLLLQQEIGGGVNIFSTPDRQLRTGLSENLFTVLQTADPTVNNFRAVESGFVETEWGLPWRIVVKDRGVLYYSLAIGAVQGWENRFEIDKKLTETLSIGVSHELRHSEDLSVQDYRLLKLLVGLDF